jgi:hypothetical protein
MNENEKRPADKEDETSGSANTLPAAPDDDDDSALGDTDQHSDAAA